MESQTKNNGWVTFLEHWGFLLMAILAAGISLALPFFYHLKGTPWIYFFIASSTLLISGAALILYAKIPVYRSGRFFTFGAKSIPESLRRIYRWGWRIFLIGVALSLCLLLSNR